MIRIEPSFVPKLAKKARLKLDRHSRKYMILYPERGLELSDSAAQIAKKCDGSRTVATIVVELVAEHVGASAQVVEADVVAFVSALRDKGLLEPS
jgi:coenzyme PQQ biosynthesis protein PqqD